MQNLVSFILHGAAPPPQVCAKGLGSHGQSILPPLVVPRCVTCPLPAKPAHGNLVEPTLSRISLDRISP